MFNWLFGKHRRVGPAGETSPSSETGPVFQFEGRWKEELVVKSAEGSFVLELPMGVLTAYLPTEEEWRKRAPVWARPHWAVLKAQLEAWCRKNKARFIIDPTADVRPEP